MKMKMRIEFNTDSAAFEEGFTNEVAEVLNQVIHKALWLDGGTLQDTYGNTIGQWVHEEEATK
jgi:hypothetical protein